jgi:hypothetical protein
MNWKRLLAYITVSVDQELLLRNELLLTENRIFKNQIKGRLQLTDLERISLVSPSSRDRAGALSRPCHTPSDGALSAADEARWCPALVRTGPRRGGGLPISRSTRADPSRGEFGWHGELGDAAGDVQPQRDAFRSAASGQSVRQPDPSVGGSRGARRSICRFRADDCLLDLGVNFALFKCEKLHEKPDRSLREPLPSMSDARPCRHRLAVELFSYK